MGGKRAPIIERVWRYVDVQPAACWLWTGTLATCGYGRITRGHGQHEQAHRIVYEILVGPIPEGLELDHLCRVRACVNPDHLEPVTHRENIRRGIGTRKGTCSRGHDITNPANVYARKDGRGYGNCLQCRREQRASRFAVPKDH